MSRAEARPVPARRRRWLVGTALAATALTAPLVAGGGDPLRAAPAAAGVGILGEPAQPAAATGTAVSWTGDLSGRAPCPEGLTRDSLLYRQTFEGGIPESRFNDGWYTFGGLGSSRSARALVDSSDGVDYMHLPYVDGVSGARTMLALATKATQRDSAYTRAQVNSVDLRVGAGSSWEGRVYDVTAATDDEGGWLGTWFEHRTKGGAQAMWDLDSVQLYTCRNAPVTRVAGSDRYSTAAKIASTYPAGVPVAYLATGASFPDAISVSALAARQDAPVLLTRKDELPSATAAQLQRLRPQRLVVLGGTAAVSTDVQDDAAAYAGSTSRLSGSTRYDVSAATASSYSPGVATLYVASGAAFPDALSIGALAGRDSQPLLLTSKGQLPPAVAAEVARLDPQRIIVVGGTSAISDAVVAQLRQHTSGGVGRISGTDRYEVSAAIARRFASGLPKIYLASGTNFPDALVGAARAGSQGVPVLLSRPTSLPGDAASALDALSPRRGVLLGGRTALSSLVMDLVGARVG